MSDSEVLRELSGTLSDKERAELLEKIRKSLHMYEETEDDIVEKPVDKKERDKRIRKEIADSSFITKIILWFRTLLSGKSKGEVYLNGKINELKKRIQRRNPGLTGFETRNLSPKLADLFFDVYVKVYPLLPLYRCLWENPQAFEKVFILLLEDFLKEPKKTVEELVSIEQVEDVYDKKGTKQGIKELLIQEIDLYCKTIADEVIQGIEDEILPLYYMKDLVLFPYNDFFQFFHYTPDINSKKNLFKSASALLALRHLEKMFYAVYTAAKIEEPIHFSEKLLIQLSLLSEIDEENEEAEEKPEIDETKLASNFMELLTEVKHFKKTVPLPELIRYFKRDPYYKLMVYNPKLQLRDFYSSVLKMRILPQVDKVFNDIRKEVITKRVDSLFQDDKIKHFMYYRIYTSLDYNKIGLPVFTNIQTLNLLYNFIRIKYRKYIQEAVQILSRGILQQNRLTLNRLLVHAGATEDIYTKIDIFDSSLSPEEDDGKLFQRLRQSLSTNTSHQRLYRNLMIQKDREVRELLVKGKEAVEGIKKIFDEILTSPTEMVKERLNIFYFVQGESITLKKLLMNCSNDMDIFRKLMYQLEKIEKGS